MLWSKRISAMPKNWKLLPTMLAVCWFLRRNTERETWKRQQRSIVFTLIGRFAWFSELSLLTKRGGSAHRVELFQGGWHRMTRVHVCKTRQRLRTHTSPSNMPWHKGGRCSTTSHRTTGDYLSRYPGYRSILCPNKEEMKTACNDDRAIEHSRTDIWPKIKIM